MQEFTSGSVTAACDLIRGNKAVDLFPRIKSQTAGRAAPLCVCFYPKAVQRDRDWGEKKQQCSIKILIVKKEIKDDRCRW
jgi:hypothetical protein